MAIRQRSTESKLRSVEGRSSRQNTDPKKQEDRNLRRREKYHNDAEYRDRVIERSRKSYRHNHPKANSRLSDGLLAPGTIREVMTDGIVRPVQVEVYRMSEAAAALGRSMLTLKRWIKDELIPKPVLRDVVYNYLHYSKGELRLIAAFMAEHEKDYEYLHYTHTTTIHRIAQGIEAYRKTNL